MFYFLKKCRPVINIDSDPKDAMIRNLQVGKLRVFFYILYI